MCARSTRSCRRSRRPATACSCRTCAATARRVSATPPLRAWRSRRPSVRTSSTSPTRLRLPRFARAGLRLGRPRRRHRGGAPSGPRARDGADWRLHRSEHRQPAAAGGAGNGASALVSGTTSTPTAGAPGSRPIAARSAAICGRRGRRTGASATTPTTGPRPRSTTRISWTWSSTRTGIASATRPARRASRTVEARLATRPQIQAPSITLYGADDGIARPLVESPPGRACGVREAGRASSRARRRPFHAARASRGGVLGAARTPGGRRLIGGSSEGSRRPVHPSDR